MKRKARARHEDVHLRHLTGLVKSGKCRAAQTSKSNGVHGRTSGELVRHKQRADPRRDTKAAGALESVQDLLTKGKVYQVSQLMVALGHGGHQWPEERMSGEGVKTVRVHHLFHKACWDSESS